MILLPLVPWVCFHSFTVGDAVGFQQPAFARIFFWHFPCPVLATVLLTQATYFAWKYLKTRDTIWDVRAHSLTELAMFFIVLTMITGVFFSRIQWGAWWQNDPRQVSFLLVTAIYSGYFVLRSAFDDEDQRGRFSNAFHLFAILPFFFLTFVYPRLPQVETFHPNTTIMQGQLKGGYRIVIFETMLVMSLATFLVYQLKTRAGLLAQTLQNYESRSKSLENTGGDSSHSHLVRPVSLSDES